MTTSTGTYNFDPILGTMWIHKQPPIYPIVGSFMKNGWELIPHSETGNNKVFSGKSVVGCLPVTEQFCVSG